MRDVNTTPAGFVSTSCLDDDACYDGGGAFRLKRVLDNEAP